jgi:hypothetical protein
MLQTVRQRLLCLVIKIGEKFTVPKELVYEYVIATICTDIHTLQVRHDNQLVEAYEFVLPGD